MVVLSGFGWTSETNFSENAFPSGFQSAIMRNDENLRQHLSRTHVDVQMASSKTHPENTPLRMNITVRLLNGDKWRIVGSLSLAHTKRPSPYVHCTEGGDGFTPKLTLSSSQPMQQEHPTDTALHADIRVTFISNGKASTALQNIVRSHTMSFDVVPLRRPLATSSAGGFLRDAAIGIRQIVTGQDRLYSIERIK